MVWTSVALLFAALFPHPPAVSLGLAASALAVSTCIAIKGRWHLWAIAALALCIATIAFFGPIPLWASIPAVVLLALNVWWLWTTAIPHTPDPGGRHKVGIHKLELRSSDTLEQVYIWYPAQPDPLAKPRPYFTALEAKAFGSVYRAMGLPNIYVGLQKLARTHSFENAPAADHGGARRPLLVFNHGGAMSPLQSFSLMETLASNGYVTLSMTHPGESAGIAWQNGSITPIKTSVLDRLKDLDTAKASAKYLVAQTSEEKREAFDALKRRCENTLTATTRAWAKRTTAVLDLLSTADLKPPARAIFDQTDVSKIGFIGMSLGGSVSHDLCHRDKRAVAGVNLDGLNWCFEWAGKPMPTPFLQVHADPAGMARQASQILKEGPKGHVDQVQALLPNDIFYHTTRPEERVQRFYWRDRSHMFFTDQPLATRNRNMREDMGALSELILAFLAPIFDKQPARPMAEIAESNIRLVQITGFSAAPSSSH